MAERVGKPAGLRAAEAFFLERCLPGHFHNVDRLTGEMLGEEAPSPMIL